MIDALVAASSATSALVAVFALGFAILAFRSGRRTTNRALALVGMAFVVFTVKNAFSAYNVVAHERASWPSVPHDALELVLSLFDLGLMVLLIVPLLLRRRS